MAHQATARRLEAAVVLADWLMAGVQGQSHTRYDDEARGSMAYVLGKLCAAGGLTDRRHTQALVDAVHEHADALTAGVVRARDLLSDDDLAPCVTYVTVEVVYRHLGTPGLHDVSYRVMARMINVERMAQEGGEDVLQTHDWGVAVTPYLHTWAESTMQQLTSSTREQLTRAICAMTLLPSEMVTDRHLSRALYVIGLNESAEQTDAAQFLATQVVERLEGLPGDQEELAMISVLDMLGGSWKAQDDPVIHERVQLIRRGLLRLWYTLPLRVVERSVGYLLVRMLNASCGTETVDVCVEAMTGRPDLDGARVGAMFRAHLEACETTGFRTYLEGESLCYLLSHAQLPHATLAACVDPLLRLMLRDDELAHSDLGRPLERLAETLLPQLTPEQIMPYLSNLVALKPEQREGRRVPAWRAVLLSRVPFEALEPHFNDLVPYLHAHGERTYNRLLPHLHRFPRHLYAPLVDRCVRKLGVNPDFRDRVTSRRMPEYDECARPMLRAMALLDHEAMSSPSLRAAAALSRLLDVDVGYQRQAWALQARLPPDVIGPHLTTVLDMLPSPSPLQPAHDESVFEELDWDARKQYINGLKLSIHERAEVITSTDGRGLMEAALASDHPQHRIVALQFLRLLPRCAVALIVDEFAAPVAARLGDTDARVRCEAMYVMRRVRRDVASAYVVPISHRIEEGDPETRRVALETLLTLSIDTLAPLIGWAVQRLIISDQSWEVRECVKQLLLELMTRGSGVPEVTAHASPLLGCLLRGALPQPGSKDGASCDQNHFGPADAALSVAQRYMAVTHTAAETIVVPFIQQMTQQYTQALQRVLPSLLRLLQNAPTHVLQAREIWLSLLLTHPDEEVRIAALPVFHRLPALTQPQAIDHAVEAVLRHPTMDLAPVIGDLLSRCTVDVEGMGPAVHRLVAALRSGDGRLRWAVKRVLAGVALEAIEPHGEVVTALLRSADTSVVMATLHVLNACKHTTNGAAPWSWVVLPLVEVLHHPWRFDVSQAAARALMCRPKEAIAPHAKQVVCALVCAGDAATEAMKGSEALHALLVPEFKGLLSSGDAHTTRSALAALTHFSASLLAPLRKELEQLLNDASMSIRERALGLLRGLTAVEMNNVVDGTGA